jgi:general secretion pathway protein H
MTRSSGQAGFTLTEMLVVITILALTMGLSLPLVRNSGGAGSLDSTARVIAAKLRETRSLAIADNMRKTATFDLKARILTSPGSGAPIQIPEAYILILTTADNLAMGEQGGFSFFADGGATGGSITLTHDELVRRIAVNWLTGAIVIAEEAKQ